LHWHGCKDTNEDFTHIAVRKRTQLDNIWFWIQDMKLQSKYYSEFKVYDWTKSAFWNVYASCSFDYDIIFSNSQKSICIPIIENTLSGTDKDTL
jgi:predicted phosphoadenosine phosphosulfate sulfurtransferase